MILRSQNGFSAVGTVLVIIVIAGFGIAGWMWWQADQDAASVQEEAQTGQESENKENQDEDNQKDEEPAPVVFEATELNPGDKVGTMETVKVERINENTGLDNDNVSATFTGKVTVTGTYEQRTGLLEGACLEDLDNSSEQKLPRAKTDERSVWFCFSNKDEAKRKLEGKEGQNVTVVINDYTYKHHPSEAKNTTRLIEVK